MTAGHETSSHFLTLLLRRTLQDRSVWSGLIADPSVISAVVEEALRMDGPVQSLWRRAKVDAEVGGVSIPAGARLSLILGSGNVDEAKFESPTEFRLDRYYSPGL